MKSRAECLAEYGSDYMIQQKVNAGELFKVGKATYSEYDLATDRDAAKIRDKRVRQYFSPSGFFEQGVETVNYKGYPVRMYSKERMLIELLRYKSKLPYDYYKEVILNYRKIMPGLNIQMIQDYAYDAPRSGKIMERLQTEVM